MAQVPLADELSAVFTRAAGLLLTEDIAGDALSRLAEAVREVMPDTVGAGMSLFEAGGRTTSTASTRRVVQEADRLQYDLGEGPCLTAWAQGSPVRVDDVRRETRWPLWATAMGGLPVRACLSAPLLTPDRVIGTMKVYSSKPSAYTADSEQLLVRLAAPAAVILGNLQPRDAAARLSEEFRDALRRRDVINTAKGMLMADLGVGSEEAMIILIVAADGARKPLHTVAAEFLGEHVDDAP